MCSLSGLSSGVLVLPQLSLSAAKRVRVSLGRASTRQETAAGSERARSSALQVPLLLGYSSSDFCVRAFLDRFHRQMFQPGLGHPWFPREEILRLCPLPLRKAFSSKGSACCFTITCLFFSY